MINKCMESFHIVIFDDRSFSKLLPIWPYSKTIALPPVARMYGFLELLHMYGGMITPISFVCFKDLINLYHKGTKNNTMFVCENVNYDTLQNTIFIPDANFMGANKGSLQVVKLSQYIRNHLLGSFSYNEPALGKIRQVISDMISNNEIVLIKGHRVGIKSSSYQPITTDELMSYTSIPLHVKSYGIWIPHEQITKRTKYQWFSRLSESQIEQSKLILCIHLINAYRSTLDYTPCSNTRNTTDNGPIVPITDDRLEKLWWNTPLIHGLYGPKPLYLGYDVLPTK
jgi:hypothetical protein